MSPLKIFLKLLFYLFSFLALVILVIVIFASSIPYNTITPNYKIKEVVNTLTPEGWGFFTKSPRDEMADIYRVEGSSLIKFSMPNAEPENIFGLSRKSRKIGMEISMIGSKVPQNSWQLIPKLAFENLPAVPVKVGFDSTLYYLRPGRYVITAYEPIPWAWATLKNHLHRKIKIAYVDYGNKPTAK